MKMSTITLFFNGILLNLKSSLFQSGKLEMTFESSSKEGVSDLYWAYKGQLLVGHSIVPDIPDVRSLQVIVQQQLLVNHTSRMLH